MPTTDDQGWASWLSQFLPQIGAPPPGNALNSPAAGPTLGRLGLGGYAPPGGQPGEPMQIGMPPGPMDPSIIARLAGQRAPMGGATGSWTPGPAAPSTAQPGSGQLGGATGSWGMPARPVTPTPQQPGGAQANMPYPGQIDPSGQWGPTSAGAPMSGAPPNTSPSGGGIGSDYAATARTAPGRPAPVSSAPAGPLSRGFVQIQRPNMPAGGGPQGRGGPPMMSALDLSRLFGWRGANG
jgi:hypothetical protein